jgi:hypothetical protein
LCSSLSTVTIPTSVATIGPYAFAYCSSLNCVVISGSTVVDATAFYYDPLGGCSSAVP